MTKDTPLYDVAVLGYGLTGNTAALYLAKRGHRVLVLEKSGRQPREVYKAGRIEEQALELWKELLPAPWLAQQLYPLKGNALIDSAGRSILQFLPKPFYQSAGIYGFKQPLVQSKLRQEARAEPSLDLFYEQEVLGLEYRSHFWEIEAKHLGRLSFFRARYILVCDGQESHIVDLLDWPEEDLGYSKKTLYIETRSPRDLETEAHVQSFLDRPHNPTRISHNAREQRWAFEFEPEEEVGSPEDLLAPFAAGQELKVESSFEHRFRTKILKKWQDKQLFVLGDAAHVMPPYLGLGLSAALLDTWNICWKLHYVLSAWQSEALLYSYQTEREGHLRKMLNLNMQVYRLFGRSRWNWLRYLIPFIPKALIDRSMSTKNFIARGFSSLDEQEEGLRSLVGAFWPRRGEALPNINLEDTHGYTRGVYSPGQFCLFAWGENPIDALRVCDISLLASWRCHFVKIIGQQEPFEPHNRFLQVLRDKEGHLAAWRKKESYRSRRPKYCLLRPDGIVYDIASNEQELDLVLDRLYSQSRLLKKRKKRIIWGDNEPF